MDDVGDYLGALGRVIRAERERLGMTVGDLAEESGCHFNTIHRVEGGSNTTVGCLWWISNGLDITMSELCELAEKDMNKTLAETSDA